MSHPLDEVAPALAKWLAPYVAAELKIAGPDTPDALSPDYDDHTCQVYISGIGTAVLPRAEAFFFALAGHAAEARPPVDSLELVEALNAWDKSLNITSPRQLPSLLTNSLKRRAKTLGLPVPWTETKSPEGRIVWLDRDGIAGRLLGVLNDEEEMRYGHPADDRGGPYSVEKRRALAEKDVVD
jgi:hypothetical protein